MQKSKRYSLTHLLEADTDGSGDLSPDELRDLADDLEGEPLTGQALRDALVSHISDMHKDIYGKRANATALHQLSTEELEQEHDKIDQQHKDWWYEERHREDQDMWIADEERETEELMDPEEGEEFPKQMGMGRGRIRESKMKITRKQLRQIIKEELSVMEEATRSKPWAWQLPGSSIPGRQPDYGEGNLTISDVQELFPSLSRGEQDDIWEKYKHLNNAGELKAAILGL